VSWPDRRSPESKLDWGRMIGSGGCYGW